MPNAYWVQDWTRFRRDEVLNVPASYKIHSDFTQILTESEVRTAFSRLNAIFRDLYGRISDSPELFGMPLHLKTQYRHFSQQWRDSGQAPYRPLMLMYYLLISGELSGSYLKVSAERFKRVCNVKNTPKIFAALAKYGVAFEGLKNNRVVNDIEATYPNYLSVLILMKSLADKAHNTGRIDDFLCCHFRLLQDDFHTADYGFGADDVADRTHSDAEHKFVYAMDEALTASGYFSKPYGGYEGRGIAYYNTMKAMETKKPYFFRMVTRSADIVGSVIEKEKLKLLLRIRNISRCLEYIESCPESVKAIFRYSDEGCANRPCHMGVSYEFESNQYWRCGCCSPAFSFKPNIDDIPHYINLVKLGEKK